MCLLPYHSRAVKADIEMGSRRHGAELPRVLALRAPSACKGRYTGQAAASAAANLSARHPLASSCPCDCAAEVWTCGGPAASSPRRDGGAPVHLCMIASAPRTAGSDGGWGSRVSMEPHLTGKSHVFVGSVFPDWHTAANMFCIPGISSRLHFCQVCMLAKPATAANRGPHHSQKQS